jgi:hypothetical protein
MDHARFGVRRHVERRGSKADKEMVGSYVDTSDGTSDEKFTFFREFSR